MTEGGLGERRIKKRGRWGSSNRGLVPEWLMRYDDDWGGISFCLLCFFLVYNFMGARFRHLYGVVGRKGLHDLPWHCLDGWSNRHLSRLGNPEGTARICRVLSSTRLV